MGVHVLTNWNVSIRSNGELFHNTLGMNLCLPEVAPHLSRSCLMRPVGSSDLDSMVLRLIRPDGFDICCDLAALQLQRKHARTCTNHARKSETHLQDSHRNPDPVVIVHARHPAFPCNEARTNRIWCPFRCGVRRRRGQFGDGRAEVPNAGRRRQTP
jgi:hypothetical protein